jgi:cobalt-zinc-cadmium resistance protein CzcA
MLQKVISISLKNKLIVLLFSLSIVAYGIYALFQIPIGAVPDITNNQVQVITTSRNLATEDVEKYLSYPVELEMANLPGVKEIRSISKFGLSVVTIVFEDDLGTYLPRQLIAEKLKSATAEIPEGFGTPFMGPISTGLGEIYQYTLEVDSAYEGRYSITELRTIQDWIVRRQLSGIPGVVEVNTWGGYLKQYRVALNPELLRSQGLSLNEVYTALKNNNGLAGGAYIEKGEQTWFIRSEGLARSIADIENIVVTNRDGSPILVRDIAEVEIGAAPRFGAITANGKGEKVMGQIMMLKDANSKAVIEAVKERVASIEGTLPPGIHINPFLERSELIGKTTFTIAENLILGFLIVIFVVVLLLGNWRSGIVVASLIPISLLFAISLMHIFGIDANLMSLGAIDFGIIIDGAVIIVEYIAFRLNKEAAQYYSADPSERRSLVDGITNHAASKMMHSAVFGQLIIIIVFIPILSLVGVEGKMFRPMALVFSFALIGAMIMCFTYIPVISSLFLKPKQSTKLTLSQRMMRFLESYYRPILAWALKRKKLVLSSALVLLIAAVSIFMQIGGEFVPTLDEGDYVIQPVLKTGTSLERTIELTTEMEEILLDFPEVDQVVSRIGAAEVPTDPMSMEEADVIIKLKPRSEWVNADSKDDLANQLKEALEVLPGIEYEFTQPIEMRFNELITGVRADLAIKVFGEDLETLSKLAYQIKEEISEVPGASDISVEKIVGLPQLKVELKRAQLARYGLQVDEVNQLISTAYAGSNLGVVFEGEKRFDLNLRFAEEFRDDLEDLQRATIQAKGGSYIPLSAVADISLTKGPAKVSRDDTRRRIVVGVNVRNRDLESVVEDVQRIVDAKIQLPPAYNVEYGGQFQNLRSARNRLMYAVPVALILIFIMLYFAFKSVSEALMIYSAIPLSAVGGILLLYLRDLPFSISAGVGFIALFGIAVLNGIVLIEEFRELKEKGVHEINERVLKGAVQRLRPVLLTASAAALGFLPMAVSSSAGAEVQRPLATVVIGGLISSTLLTLIVLPVLYSIWQKPKKIKDFKAGTLVLVLALILPGFASAQERSYSLEELQAIAIANNPGLQARALETEAQEAAVSGAVKIAPTEVYYAFDENNIAENNAPIQVWGIQQNLEFPSTYYHQRKLQKSKLNSSHKQYAVALNDLKREVGQAYYEIIYWSLMERDYQQLQGLYANSSEKAKMRFEGGDSPYVDFLTAQSKQEETAHRFREIVNRKEIALRYLASLLRSDSILDPQQKDFPKLESASIDSSENVGMAAKNAELQMALNEQSLVQSQWWPGISLEYFQGTNSLPQAQIYQGWQIGLQIPLWFATQSSKTQVSAIKVEQKRAEKDDYGLRLQHSYTRIIRELSQYQQAIRDYENIHLPLAEELQKQAKASWDNGEIGYLDFVQLNERASNIRTEYLRQQWQYYQGLIELKYLIVND